MGRGVFVRVNPQIEAVVRELARKTGLTSSSIRNLAILYGIEHIARNGIDIWYDEQFFERLEEVKKVLGDGKRKREEEGE